MDSQSKPKTADQRAYELILQTEASLRRIAAALESIAAAISPAQDATENDRREPCGRPPFSRQRRRD